MHLIIVFIGSLLYTDFLKYIPVDILVREIFIFIMIVIKITINLLTNSISRFSLTISSNRFIILVLVLLMKKKIGKKSPIKSNEYYLLIIAIYRG